MKQMPRIEKVMTAMAQDSVVWLDRREARVFHFSSEKMERKVLHARIQDHHTHRKDDQLERESTALYWQIIDHLTNTDRILLLGPGMAKKHFGTFAGTHAPDITSRIIGCETVDHPSDPEIAAYASRYFSGRLGISRS